MPRNTTVYEIRTVKNNALLARTSDFKRAIRMATQFRKVYGHDAVRIDTIESKGATE